ELIACPTCGVKMRVPELAPKDEQVVTRRRKQKRHPKKSNPWFTLGDPKTVVIALLVFTGFMIKVGSNLAKSLDPQRQAELLNKPDFERDLKQDEISRKQQEELKRQFPKFYK